MLFAHSYYSFKYGTVAPNDLVDIVADLGYQELVLADVNSTSASLNFVRLAQKKGLRPILGIDFRNQATPLYIGVAKNNAGFAELNQHLSFYRHSKKKFAPEAPEHWQNCFVIYPIANMPERPLHQHEFIGVRPADLSKLTFSKKQFVQEKLVILQTATFRHKRDFNAHRLLRAIDQNTLLSKLDKAQEGHPADRYISKAQLLEIYHEWPQLIYNTQQLLDQCSIKFEFGEEIPHKNRKTYTKSEKEDWQLINQLCKDGLAYRYPETNQLILDRIERELEVIRSKGFLAYFLITWDILKEARNRGFFYVGRGSGANSIVAYILRITDVDPIELDLYFERFINLFRRNPPDFDIDFSWKDRPSMTQYIFDRFGYQYTALLGAYVTFQYRAIVRQLGKVFGLPKHEIDRIAEGEIQHNQLDQLGQLVLKYGQYIQGFPSHLSIHAGGIIISESPITHYTATDLPPKGYPTTHFDMVIAEDIGLYKYDILGQRGLAKIKDTLTVIGKNQKDPSTIDIHDIKRFKEDKKVKQLLKSGKAIGCFYVESPAMRMLLTKLQVDDYLGLVAASSIIRPGVAKSGMMKEYIKRFRNPAERKKAHPVMMKIMPETFGVMVYQEDVIKVAHYFADLTLGEADVLRRGMSGKYRSREEFKSVKQKFFSNCRAKGYTQNLTSDVWRQIESFAGYAFAKGHSASYAVESYQSLFLKAHYPLEYLVATINNGGGFYSTELYLHEAKMQGAIIHPPCVNRSFLGCSIYRNEIYIGFSFIHAMSESLAKTILTEREQNGLFKNFEDFLDRVAPTIDEIESLIRINAFQFCGELKRSLMWKAHSIISSTKEENITGSLFKAESKTFQLPDLTSSAIEDLFDQIELLGFPLISPWLILEKPTTTTVRAKDLTYLIGEKVKIQGYLITVKNTSTSNGKRMHFGTFIDQDGNWIDTVHFPPIASTYPFRGKGVYSITGTVIEEYGMLNIEVESLKKEPYIPDPRYSEENIQLPKIKTSNLYQLKIGTKKITSTKYPISYTNRKRQLKSKRTFRSKTKRLLKI